MWKGVKGEGGKEKDAKGLSLCLPSPLALRDYFFAFLSLPLAPSELFVLSDFFELSELAAVEALLSAAAAFLYDSLR